MNIHYESLNNFINLTHDVESLTILKAYNDEVKKLFYSLIIEDTKKPIFDCCRDYLKYLDQLYDVIEVQITNTLNDMEYSQPADEED